MVDIESERDSLLERYIYHTLEEMKTLMESDSLYSDKYLGVGSLEIYMIDQFMKISFLYDMERFYGDHHFLKKCSNESEYLVLHS